MRTLLAKLFQLMSASGEALLLWYRPVVVTAVQLTLMVFANFFAFTLRFEGDIPNQYWSLGVQGLSRRFTVANLVGLRLRRLVGRRLVGRGRLIDQRSLELIRVHHGVCPIPHPAVHRASARTEETRTWLSKIDRPKRARNAEPIGSRLCPFRRSTPSDISPTAS